MARARDEAEPGDPLGKLGAILRAYLCFATGNPAHQRVLLSFPKGVGVSWSDRATTRPGGKVGLIVIEALEACAATGHPLRVPPQLACQVILVGAFGRVVLAQASRGLYDGASVPEFVTELMSLVFERGVVPSAFDA